jgi:hypothetical protein
MNEKESECIHGVHLRRDLILIIEKSFSELNADIQFGECRKGRPCPRRAGKGEREAPPGPKNEFSTGIARCDFRRYN